ncbi:MAG: ParA family protein [Candidatus Omnitrophota bacterium]
MGEIIAICNQKGGVGKTTTAVNLSAYLALAGKKVLLIDLDPQANATSGLGVDKRAVQQGIFHFFLEDTAAEQVVLPTEIQNLFLIPSNEDLMGAEVVLVSEIGREGKLRQALGPLANQYDFIFIDSPPSLGLLTINALVTAHSVMIPMQCEYYALEGLSQLMRTIELVRERLNAPLLLRGVLLTMADFRTNLTEEVIQEARNFFKDKVYQTVIPRSVRLSEAPGFGKPIALYDANCLGAQKYRELSQEILTMEVQTAPWLNEKS